jgi:hypothetical protein
MFLYLLFGIAMLSELGVLACATPMLWHGFSHGFLHGFSSLPLFEHNMCGSASRFLCMAFGNLGLMDRQFRRSEGLVLSPTLQDYWHSLAHLVKQLGLNV